MADPRFFTRHGPFTVGWLATLVGGAVMPGADSALILTDVASLSEAGPEHLSFLDNRKYTDHFRATKAGACLVTATLADEAPAGTIAIICDEPYRAYAKAAAAFYPAIASTGRIHPSAIIDPTALLADGVEVGAGVVIGQRVEIARGTRIAGNVVIDDGVVIGEFCTIGANASISHALIGAHVLIYPGCRIGQDGFGFAMGPRGHLKVPQLGRVVIGDDVEIGANCTIDRGAGPDTIIGRGCRIDNLVQIAHNVILGAGCVLVSQAGIAGSTTLGAGVVIAGQSGIAGHLTLGAGSRVAGHSGVMRDIPPGVTVMGVPAMPIKQFWRELATLQALARRPDR